MYHITSRAIHKERYLQSAVAKDLFIEQLTRMREKHDCRIIDFMVMNNHIHLVLQPGQRFQFERMYEMAVGRVYHELQSGIQDLGIGMGRPLFFTPNFQYR